jgi:ABC-type tungstate transport system permease subunit
MMKFAYALRMGTATFVLAISLVGSAAPRNLAWADDSKPAVGLIMEKLPPQSSSKYKKLRKLAGKATGQALEMTKSEVWNVPPEHVDRLIEEAARQGVVVTRLDSSWNRTLAPADKGAPMTEDQKRMMNDAMESKAAMGMSMMALPKPSMLEYALTKDMHGSAKGDPAPTIVIPLNEALSITVRRKHIEMQGDSYIWHGTIEGTGEPVTLVCWPGGRLTGNISHKGHMYSIKSMGGGMHGVVELAPDGLPPEHAPMSANKMREMNMKDDPLVKQGDAMKMEDAARDAVGTDSHELRPDRSNLRNLEDAPIDRGVRTIVRKTDPTGAKHLRRSAKKNSKRSKTTEITLMVAYTKAAAARYSDIEKDLIALAVADTNQSLRESGVSDVKIKLVHAYQTDYVEKGGHFEHVYAMVRKDDGVIDEVHPLRDKYKADVNVLVVHDPVGCGLAARVAAEADRSFAVVHQECAATSYSLAHEIGHLIGARHDLALDDSMDPYPHGHGFVNGTNWRTMMSYKDSCGGCPRLPIWSNPDIKIDGVPAGDAKADNARVLRDRASVVSKFR